MQMKLLTSIVAAAVLAPAIASAEAVLYGRINQSLDYQEVTNSIAPTWGVTFTDPSDGQRDEYPAAASPIETARDAINAGSLNPRLEIVEPGVDFKGWALNRGRFMQGASRGNRIGVRGSEDLGNGLSAIYQIELGIETANSDNDIFNGDPGRIRYRNTFVGLEGNWGRVLLGRHDLPLRITTSRLDLFADTMADYNGTVGFDDIRADNVILYRSPSFSGFQFLGAVVPSGGATMTGANNIDSDSINEGWSIGATYRNGPFHASIAYESIGNNLMNDTPTSLAGNNCPVEDPAAGLRAADTPFASQCTFTSDDYTKWRLGLGLLSWNGFNLTGIYEEHSNPPGSTTYTGWTDPVSPGMSYRLPGGNDKARLWQIQASYEFGNNEVTAMYGQQERSGDQFIGSDYAQIPGLTSYYEDLYEGDLETWAIGFDHSFSRRTRMYVVYTAVGDDRKDIVGSSEWSGFSLGLRHLF